MTGSVHPADSRRAAGRRWSVLSGRLGESGLAHLVYGLILTMATLGELVDHHTEAYEASRWLLGAAGVLLAAHVFSSGLAHLAAAGENPDWRELVRVGRHELSVTAGSVTAAAVMVIAGVTGMDAERTLTACVVGGLVALFAISFRASTGHRWVVRGGMSTLAALIGGIIVTLENTV